MDQLARGSLKLDKEISMAEDRKTILVVEDEPDTATYLSALLGDAGYDTVLAEDGEKALEIVKATGSTGT
jgi:CheY-like chemotaxis protein